MSRVAHVVPPVFHIHRNCWVTGVRGGWGKISGVRVWFGHVFLREVGLEGWCCHKQPGLEPGCVTPLSGLKWVHRVCIWGGWGMCQRHSLTCTHHIRFSLLILSTIVDLAIIRHHVWLISPFSRACTSVRLENILSRIFAIDFFDVHSQWS